MNSKPKLPNVNSTYFCIFLKSSLDYHLFKKISIFNVTINVTEKWAYGKYVHKNLFDH